MQTQKQKLKNTMWPNGAARFSFLALCLFLLPQIACANVGSPFIFLIGGSWVFFFAQFGIIPIEAKVIKSLLIGNRQDRPTWKRSFAYSFIANLATTIIGVIVLAFFSVLIFSGFLAFSYLGGIPLIVVYFVLAFYLSVFFETRIAYKFFKNYEEIIIKKRF